MLNRRIKLFTVVMIGLVPSFVCGSSKIRTKLGAVSRAEHLAFIASLRESVAQKNANSKPKNSIAVNCKNFLLSHKKAFAAFGIVALIVIALKVCYKKSKTVRKHIDKVTDSTKSLISRFKDSRKAKIRATVVLGSACCYGIYKLASRFSLSRIDQKLQQSEVELPQEADLQQEGEFEDEVDFHTHERAAAPDPSSLD